MAKPDPQTEPDLQAGAGLDTRRAALDILERVSRGAPLEDALAQCRSFWPLEGADRKFARALASETLRRRGGLDHLIGAYLDRPLPKRAARVMDILRIAAAQLLIFRTPDHAAVSTAVALAADRKETAGYGGLINAVARKIAKQGPAALEALPDRTDAPGWLWRALERAYGPQRARAIVAAHRRPAPLDLTLKDPSEQAAWAEKLGADALPTGGLRLPGDAAVAALAGYDEGAWWVQDAAASLPARLLGDIAGKTVLDLCAAPGGKTMQLAAAGARVAAVDISAPRLERVAENLQRTKLQAELVEADLLKWTPPQPADAVLLDAPCTATGTIRRHPDLPWIKSPDDVAALASLQGKMIDRAVSFLKPGGVLVYAVCSLLPEEGENQAAAALGRHANLAREPVETDALGVPGGVTRDGDLRTLPSVWPERGGMDGFFAARFRLQG